MPGRLIADLKIARGLDYYTGTVYETELVGFESWGSISSGGRYDSLASDGRISYPGVGLSIGVTRLLAPLLAKGMLRASRPVPTAVLVAVDSEETAARQSKSPSGCGAGGSRPRSPRARRSSAVRSATPTAAASPLCGSAAPLAARSKTSGAESRYRPTHPHGCRALKI